MPNAEPSPPTRNDSRRRKPYESHTQLMQLTKFSLKHKVFSKAMKTILICLLVCVSIVGADVGKRRYSRHLGKKSGKSSNSSNSSKSSKSSWNGSGKSRKRGGTAKLSISALASSIPEFSTLVSLLKSADLVGTLSKDSADGKGYTVFAPTNDAFDKLGDVNLTQEQLKQVLLYHVVAGTVTSDQLSDGQVVPTLNGQDLIVGISGGSVTLNGNAVVTGVDNVASNGVVHIIDTVLVPNL
ncbi:hypothetical protein HJC23_009492 [Cyclotella cryptica]|uniref:FAS1 domain-containing protein n=1 Tax=Cyclotella cryptica TaxID=29204 RepID=A0ABD3P7A6_9STRA